MRLLVVTLAVLTAQAHGQEEDVCPCRDRLECPDHYGTRALDVLHYGVLAPCPKFGFFRCCDRDAGSRHHGGVQHHLGVRHHGSPHRRRQPVRAVSAKRGSSHVSGSTTNGGTAVRSSPSPQQAGPEEIITVTHQGSTEHQGSTQPLDGLKAPSITAHRSQTDNRGISRSPPSSVVETTIHRGASLRPASPSASDSTEQAPRPIGSHRSPPVHQGSHEHHVIFPSDAVSLENVESHFEEELSDAKPAHHLGHPAPSISGELDTAEVHSNSTETVLVTDATFPPDPVAEAVFLESEEAGNPNSHFQNEEVPVVEVIPEQPAHSVITGKAHLDQYTLDDRAARRHPRIRAFRSQTVTPVANITRTGELSPPCGCYTCGTCRAAHLEAGYDALITCPAGFDRCCFPEDPWPDFVATEAESLAPCALPSRCRRSYGVSPLDVQLFGALLPCYLGQVRCLDLLLQEAELMSPLLEPLPCPAAGVRGAGLSPPILDFHFKEMSLSQPSDLTTRPHRHFKEAASAEPTTELSSPTSSAHSEKVSSSELGPGESDYDGVPPTQPGEGSSSTNVLQESGKGDGKPVALKDQISVPDFFKPQGSGSLGLEETSPSSDNLPPVRKYLLPTEPFQTPEVPALEEKIVESPIPVINSAYLPPISDVDGYGEVVESSPRVSEYGTQGSELHGSASSLILDLNGAKSSVNFDLDEAASSFDYDLDEAESVTKLVGTSISPATTPDPKAPNESWLTDDLATAASLLSSVGDSHHHHHSPEPHHHHHQQHGDHSEPLAHQFPSSGLHVIPAPDLSLFPPQFAPESTHSADLDIGGGFTSDELPSERPSATQPASLIENDHQSEPSLPRTYLPVPMHASHDSTDTSQQSDPVRFTVSDSLTDTHQLGTDFSSMEHNQNNVDVNDNKGGKSDSLAGTVFDRFMGMAKLKDASFTFPDSVSVEIKESQHSSIQIPIPCRPLSSCRRLFGNSARDFEVLGSLPGCPEGEGRCLDHVLMVYTRIGKHEEVLLGDMSALKTSGTIIEIKGAPTAGPDGPGQSMVVRGPPGFRKTVAFFGGKAIFPAASEQSFPGDVPSLEKEETVTSATDANGNAASGGSGSATPTIVTHQSGEEAVVTGAIGAGEAEVEIGGHEAGGIIANGTTGEGLVTDKGGDIAVPDVSGSVEVVTGSNIGGSVEVQTSGIDIGSAVNLGEAGIDAGSESGISITGGLTSEEPELQTGGIHISGEISGQASTDTGGATVVTTGGSLVVETGTQTGGVDISGISGEGTGEVDIGSLGGDTEIQTAGINISGGVVAEIDNEAGGSASGAAGAEVAETVTTSGGTGGQVVVEVGEHGAVPAGSGSQGYGSVAAGTHGAGMGPHSTEYRTRPWRPLLAHRRPSRPRIVYGAPTPNLQYGTPQSKIKPKYGPPPPQPRPQYRASRPKPKQQYGPPPPQPEPKPQYGPPPPQPEPKPQYGPPPPQPEPTLQYGPPPSKPVPQYGPPKTQPKPTYGPPPALSYGTPPLQPRPTRPLYKTPPVVKVPKPRYPAPRPSSHYGSPPPVPVRIPMPGYPAPRPGSQYGSSHPTPIKISKPGFPVPRPNSQYGPAPVYGSPTPVRVVQPKPQYGPPRLQHVRPGYPPARPGSHYG